MAMFEFRFPDVGEGIQDGKVVAWKVKKGDAVKSDQVLVEMETDKAVVEIPSPYAGKIVQMHGSVGDTVKVGAVLVTLEVDDNKVGMVKGSAMKGGAKNIAHDESAANAQKAGGVVGFIPESEDELFKRGNKIEKKAEAFNSANSVFVLATPAIRQLAKDKGIDISAVKGSGADGRITAGDIENAAKKGIAKLKNTDNATLPQQTASAILHTSPQPKIVKKYDMWGYINHVPLKGIRKATAQHMENAWKIPTVWHMDEADVTRLAVLREKEKISAEKNGIKLTYLAYVVKAAVLALQKHPVLNATLDLQNEDILVKKYYNIGIAVDAGDGLVVPVVKGVDKKEVYAIAHEITIFAEKAKNKKLDLGDLQGGSFTISNLGVIGGTQFTPIINSPEAAILGVGKMQEKAVVADGKVAIRKILPLVLGYDHRVCDGAEAARFMNELIALLQSPERIV